MKNYIKNYIRKIVLELINEAEIAPKFKELKSLKIIDDKMSIWDMITRYKIERLSFQVRYKDIESGAEDFTYNESKDTSQLYNYLKKFNPKHQYFSNASLRIDFTHNGISDYKIQNLTKGYDKIYSSDDIGQIIEPILEWLQDRPELLI